MQFKNKNDAPLSLIIGLLISESMDYVSGKKINAGLKWPNDLLINNKKICGYRCSLWDKKQSVYNALSRLNIQTKDIKKISPIHLYKNYCNLLKDEGEKERFVSKQYFMDYIY